MQALATMMGSIKVQVHYHYSQRNFDLGMALGD